jgi:hypothetical protein
MALPVELVSWGLAPMKVCPGRPTAVLVVPAAGQSDRHLGHRLVAGMVATVKLALAGRSPKRRKLMAPTVPLKTPRWEVPAVLVVMVQALIILLEIILAISAVLEGAEAQQPPKHCNSSQKQLNTQEIMLSLLTLQIYFLHMDQCQNPHYLIQAAREEAARDNAPAGK